MEENYKDLILSIYIDEDNARLALLKCGKDCSLFIEIKELNGNISQEIKLDMLYFSENKANELSLYKNYNPEYSKFIYELNDNTERKFHILNEIYSFFIDFSQGLIFFECLSDFYKIKNCEPKYDYETFIKSFKIFDFKGKVVSENLTRKNDFDEGDNYQFYQDKIISYYGGYDVFLNYFGNDYNLQEQKLSTDENLGEEYSFEYYRYFSINKEKKIFGFLGENPTYGVDGLRIFDISNIETPKIIYSKDIEDVTLNYFTISPDGKKIAYLKYGSFSNLKIYIDELNESKSNIKIIQTNYDHSKNYPILDVRFIDDFTISITLRDRFIFYSINSSIELKVIRRDEFSPFLFSKQSLYYIENLGLKNLSTNFSFKKNNE